MTTDADETTVKNDEITDLEQRLQEVERLEEKLDQQRAALEQREKSVSKRREELADKERDLTEEERRLEKLRLEAKAGFKTEHDEALEALRKEESKLESRLEQLRETIERERSQWSDKKESLADQLAEKRQKAEKAIADERSRAHEKFRQLRTRKENELEEELDAEREAFQERQKERRQTVEAQLDEKWEKAEQEMAERRDALEERADKLDAREQQLDRKRSRLDLDRRKLETDKVTMRNEVEADMADRLEKLEHEADKLKRRLEEARAQRDALDQELQRKEEAERKIGHLSPEEAHARIEELTRERDNLEDKLAELPGADAGEQLERLGEECEDLRRERKELREKNARLERQLGNANIAATKLETVRDQKEGLEARVTVLTESRDELKEEVDDLVEQRKGAKVFPVCSKMDEKEAYQREPNRLRQSVGNLEEFSEELRHRIASLGPDLNTATDERLYYTPRDIRSFLGGLSMSHLMLLQGISGTGKTSLVRAFASAVGGGSEMIAVQAGWRDKHDLLGHYNAFENVFYESDFLTALYKAQTPQWRHRPFIILLDEMNLSHPEQYFADMLHALEVHDGERSLSLAEKPVPGLPELMDEQNEKPRLRIPDNVWFIGTANHDETTVDFADKTYDRSHVMELPRQRTAFEADRQGSTDPLHLNALEDAFLEAGESHEEAADTVKNVFEDLSPLFSRHFGIGWGNRLERQADKYVPVVVAAGGSTGEAADRLLATKVLRKVKDRYDTTPEDFRTLKEALGDIWGLLDGPAPEESLELIEREIRRLEGGV